MPNVLIYDEIYKVFIFSIIKALERGGEDHLYSKRFSKNKKYAEMMYKLFEKKYTAIELKGNVLPHLKFALTWPTMSYILTVHCMLYFATFFISPPEPKA